MPHFLQYSQKILLLINLSLGEVYADTGIFALVLVAGLTCKFKISLKNVLIMTNLFFFRFAWQNATAWNKMERHQWRSLEIISNNSVFCPITRTNAIFS